MKLWQIAFEILKKEDGPQFEKLTKDASYHFAEYKEDSSLVMEYKGQTCVRAYTDQHDEVMPQYLEFLEQIFLPRYVVGYLTKDMLHLARWIEQDMKKNQ